MRKIMIPLNADSDGNSRCIKAGYYKMGCTNFIRAYVGGQTNDGFSATGIMEMVYEESDSNEPNA